MVSDETFFVATTWISGETEEAEEHDSSISAVSLGPSLSSAAVSCLLAPTVSLIRYSNTMTCDTKERGFHPEVLVLSPENAPEIPLMIISTFSAVMKIKEHKLPLGKRFDTGEKSIKKRPCESRETRWNMISSRSRECPRMIDPQTSRSDQIHGSLLLCTTRSLDKLRSVYADQSSTPWTHHSDMAMSFSLNVAPEEVSVDEPLPFTFLSIHSAYFLQGDMFVYLWTKKNKSDHQCHDGRILSSM